jgi:glutathione S-transferase
MSTMRQVDQRAKHMDKPNIIYGSEVSPYSHKIRSWFRYKKIPHRWLPTGPGSNDPEYKRLASLPIVPTVVLPDGETGLQDSTPTIERLELEHPDPVIDPPGKMLAFLSTLIEEFGDEWGIKLMFHLRWYAEVDMLASSLRAARLATPDGSEEDVLKRSAAIRERMAGSGHFVGSSDRTAPLISSYFVELLDSLDRHLHDRKNLFGGQPSVTLHSPRRSITHRRIQPVVRSSVPARHPLWSGAFA